MANAQYKFNPPVTVRRMTRILELLAQNPKGLTRLELAAATAVGDRSMKSYLAALRGQMDGHERRIRVRTWRRQYGTGGMYEAVFVLGAGPDAKHPKPLSNSARVKRYRARLKRERVEVYEDQLAHQRRKRAQARPARRDRMVAALFGPPGAAHG